MDLDFSLLTFSPSHVKKNLKVSSAGKGSSKLTLRQRRLYSTEKTKGAGACQEKYTSAANVSNMQEKLPKIDFAVGDNVIKSFGILHDKPVVKSRVSKGKENRGTADLTSDLDWSVTWNAKNDHKTSRRLSSDQCHENGSSRKKLSIEVTNSLSANTTECLASEVNTCVSIPAKSSCGKSRYFSCSQNFPKTSTVLNSESSCFSLDEICSKSKDNDAGVNRSVIIVSDSSSTSSAVMNSVSKQQIKHSLHSRTIEYNNGVQKDKCTVVIDTSDSENDVLDASCEVPFKFTSTMRTPSHSDIKSETHSNTRREKVGSVADLEYVLPPTSLQLKHTKYQDIENWLCKIKSLNGSDNDPDKMLEVSNPQKSEVTGNSVGLNSSAEEILDNLYGETWRKRNPKGSQTEPCKKKFSRNMPIAGQHTECKKQKVAKSGDSVVSSTDSEEFENFLKNVRQEFESTRRDSVQGTRDFIDDSVEDNSLGFYLGVLNSKDLKKDQLHLNCKKKNSKPLHAVAACRQLYFSSSDDDVHKCDENIGTSKPRTNEKKLNDLKEKNNVKRPQKIMVSPVKRILVKRTPKTVGQNRMKPYVDKQVSKFCSPVLSFLASLSAGTAKGRCHPEAQYYKSNFRMKKKELCSKLFKMYNDKIFDNKLPHDMLVEWNARLKRTAGFCYNRRTVTSPGTKIRTSRIELSTKVCDTADRLRDTLIHELCHAATWVVDDVKDGHGPHWKAWARKAMRVFPELPPIKRCHDYSIQTKFTYRCTGCGYSIGRHSKSLNVATKRCGHCFGMFELLVNTRRKSGTVAQQTLKKRSPAGFARFVKENYSSVKQSRTDLKHGDVMRLLGQQFSAVKIGPEARKQ